MINIPSDTKSITFPVAIVVSTFNEQVTEKLSKGALDRLLELGFPEKKIAMVKVPGAVEVPLTAQTLAKTGLYEAIICLGAVIYGETDHYEYVCQQVNQGCQRVALDYDIPVIFGVLTTRNETQALERAGGKKGNAGTDAVDAAVQMVAVMREVHDL